MLGGRSVWVGLAAWIEVAGLGMALGAAAVVATGPERLRAVEAAPAAIEFNRDVRPILADKCFKCHGPDAAHREADLRLDRFESATAPREGRRAIAPRAPEQSELMRRIESPDPDLRMPPAGANLSLSPAEIATLRRWIESGAGYEPHWAFVPPRAAALPAVRRSDWPRNEIDRLVLAELERLGVAPAPEADRATLLRRVSLALTGLPPALEEQDAFLRDPSPWAYERVVERLLASPHFGERLALDWLDAARYADTNGFYTDGERQAWPWRDWVIEAFNRNLPFDQFTVEQLAGDLLPHPTTAQRIATGFNRHHMVTDETGIIEEEYRVGYVADRVDTTATTWLGLTVGCARCHDHKYDPITQREYYQLYAAFNNVDETGIIKDVAPLSPAPALMLPTATQERQLAELTERRAEAEAAYQRALPEVDRALAAWAATALDSMPPAPREGLLAHVAFEDGATDQGPRAVPVAVVGTLLATMAGIHGRAGAFDATQYAEFDGPPALDRDRPFTLAVWVLPSGAPQGCVASKMDATPDARGFEILWYKSQPRINLAHRYGTDGIEVVADEKFGGRRWRHLAISYDGSSRAAGLKVYVDGAASRVHVRRDNLRGSIASAEPWRIAWKGTGIGFEGGIDEFRLYGRVLDPAEISAIYHREFVEGALAVPAAERTRAQTDELRNYFLAEAGPDALRQLAERRRAARDAEAALRQEVLSVSVMQEMDVPRDTFVLERGQYDRPSERVGFGVPAALGALPPGAPPNRLGLAQWLVSRDHPLTARVAVNRLWAQCFGAGLVRTPNDFGVQGEPPTHPALLDLLAVRFRDGAEGTPPWDVKALLRLIVTSATFRQASQLSGDLARRDPENRWLARGPRFRLPAELLRDQALAVSGLLAPRIGGPSVKPYQPPGLWEQVSYNGDASYQADTGEALYRRGLYTFWKRQSPPPAMLTFDGPTREVCTVSRPRTNTPLQALVLLNDETYVEAARALAERILGAPQANAAERLRWGFRLATGREPVPDELAALRHLLEAEQAAFRAAPERADALLQVGDSPADPRFAAAELAAWTLTASVLLNLDEVLTQH